MPGTVYSNIAFCNKPVSREEAVEAAKRADLDETIMKLPLGYDTEISDSNTGGFSGGQRQRLLIARAFASKPGLMILDEATSALDVNSEAFIQQAIDKLMEDRTMFIIAHRFSTIRNVQKVIVFKEGNIIDFGTPAELYERCPYYKTLYDKQSSVIQ
jgi:subfamily B ATP-binding cassette protein MsbA